jgi:alkylation response protein AidB-like acyl-CoA dehydrogenase
MTAVDTKKQVKGGEFLIKETNASEIFTPEDFNEEQRMIAQQCKDFLAKEVYPRLDEIDSMKNPKLMPEILDKAGELGLLGTSIPQDLGGFGMDFNTTMLVAEVIGGGALGCCRSFGAHWYRHAPDTLLRQRRAKEEIHSKACDRRVESGVLSHRTGFGFRCEFRKDESSPKRR